MSPAFSLRGGRRVRENRSKLAANALQSCSNLETGVLPFEVAITAHREGGANGTRCLTVTHEIKSLDAGKWRWANAMLAHSRALALRGHE